ncbi:MAG: hypothetical protein ABSC57_05640, partial [Syntrophales bacterium]
MPVFCMCGAEKYICEICKADICGKDLPATWMEVTSADEEHSGNMCPACVMLIESGNSKFSKKDGEK